VVVLNGAPGSDAIYEAVRDALAEAGCGVRRLQRRAASLEDIYLASGAP
jgi:hypothetical protein